MVGPLAGCYHTNAFHKMAPKMNQRYNYNRIITYGSERGNELDKLSLITLTYRHGSIDRIQIEVCLYRPPNSSIIFVHNIRDTRSTNGRVKCACLLLKKTKILELAI